MKTILIIIVLMIASASAVSEEAICDKAFFLLIDGKDINALIDKVGNVSEQYMTNYSNICEDFRKLPKPKEIPQSNKTICNYNLDQEVLWGVYNMNQSVLKETVSFYLENKSCEDIQNFKWIFKIEQTDDSFTLVGLRLWWILILLLLIPVWALFRASTKVSKQIERELNA